MFLFSSNILLFFNPTPLIKRKFLKNNLPYVKPLWTPLDLYTIKTENITFIAFSFY